MIKIRFIIFLVLTSGFRYIWKWWKIRKKVCWNRKMRLLWSGISRKFYLHFSFMFSLLRYYKMVQRLGIQKPVSKITGIWTTSDKQWKVQKFESWWALLQKNTFLQLKHYVQWIYLTLLSTTCVDSPIYLYHFWNYKSFFTTQLLCIFLAQTFHTFFKSSPSKFKFSDFPLLRLNFTKFLKSFFK